MISVREGSSKNTYTELAPSDNEVGSGYFRWRGEEDTGNWSIFDYKEHGEFPWSVPYQDKALTEILKKTYEVLNSQGIATCVTGIEDDKFMVHLARVPGYAGFPLDPMQIPVGTNNRMVDLEVTFNLVVHPRSSLYGRWQSGRLDYGPWGFAQTPHLWEVIPIVADGRVLYRYTTKFEKGGDRPLSEEEARERSRLTEKQWKQGNNNSTRGALAVYNYGKGIGIIVADGKHEWMVDDEGNVLIADLIGNPYDDRFVVRLTNSVIIAKHIGNYGRELNLPKDLVHELVDKAMREAKKGIYQDVSKQFQRNLYEDNRWRNEWREKKAPPPTPIKPVQQATGDMYLSVAQVWTQDRDLSKKVGKEIRDLEDVAAELWVIEELNRRGQIPWYYKNAA